MGKLLNAPLADTKLSNQGSPDILFWLYYPEYDVV
jgi:hypothetical protein